MPPSTEQEQQLRKQWGAAISTRRAAKEWSQSRLAREVGVDTGTISRIERGLFAGSETTRMAIARALGVQVHELYAYDLPPTEEAS